MANFITEQNHRLKKSDSVGSIAGTITTNGNRTRKTCGFFIPQILLIGLLIQSKAEFVTRSIRRTKAEFLRTNKASRLVAVVEALSHLKQVGKSFTKTTKRTPKMKTIHHLKDGKPSIYPIVFISDVAEVNND